MQQSNSLANGQVEAAQQAAPLARSPSPIRMPAGLPSAEPAGCSPWRLGWRRRRPQSPVQIWARTPLVLPPPPSLLSPGVSPGRGAAVVVIVAVVVVVVVVVIVVVAQARARGGLEREVMEVMEVGLAGWLGQRGLGGSIRAVGKAATTVSDLGAWSGTA